MSDAGAKARAMADAQMEMLRRAMKNKPMTTPPDWSRVVTQLLEALERAAPLVRIITVRQVIEADDKAIEAAGLNPWCMNEGLADGSESIGAHFIDAAIAAAKKEIGG